MKLVIVAIVLLLLVGMGLNAGAVAALVFEVGMAAVQGLEGLAAVGMIHREEADNPFTHEGCLLIVFSIVLGIIAFAVVEAALRR